MPSNLSVSRVRRELTSYLNGRKSLREFYDWFVPATLDVDHSAPAAVRELVTVPARRMLHGSIMAHPSRDGYRGHP